MRLFKQIPRIKFYIPKKEDLWHLFPIGDELNIKSALEILVYIILVIGGWKLFMAFQNVKTHSISLRVEKLIDYHEGDDLSNALDRIIANIANIELIIPASYQNDSLSDERFLVRFAPTSLHSVLRTREQIQRDHDCSENLHNYRSALLYVNQYYNDIDFSQKSCFTTMFKNEDKKHKPTITIRPDSTGKMVIDNVFDSLTREKVLETNLIAYTQGMPEDFFGDDPVFKIFYAKHKASVYLEENNTLKKFYYKTLQDSLGMDSFNTIPNTELYPLSYFKATVNTSIPSSFKYETPWVYLTKNNTHTLAKEVYENGTHSWCVLESGQSTEALGTKYNNVEVFLPKSASKYHPIIFTPWKLYDISKAKFHIELNTATVDSINIKLDFLGSCTFSKMDPVPDIIDMHSISFTDQWKILQIRDKGLDFYVELEEFEKVQHIRLFIIEAVMSGLIIILITFILIGFYKIITIGRINSNIIKPTEKRKIGLMKRRNKRMSNSRN